MLASAYPIHGSQIETPIQAIGPGEFGMLDVFYPQ